MKLQRIETETIINFNDAEQSASVYTCNAALRRKMDALLEQRPEDCSLVRSAREGVAREYLIPKKWIRIAPPRKVSEEQRERARKLSTFRASKNI